MKNITRQSSANCIKLIGDAPELKKYNIIHQKAIIKKYAEIFFTAIKRLIIKLSPGFKVPALAVLIMSNVSVIKAQRYLDYALHANIIYRITKYIDWPDHSGSGDFVIGVVGDTPLYKVLEDFVVNKTVGNRKIAIERMSSSTGLYNCNILFISEDKSKSLKKIAEVTKGYPILIISESNRVSIKGSCINFAVVYEHLRLQINKVNIESRNLNIASELLQLGTIVKSRKLRLKLKIPGRIF